MRHQAAVILITFIWSLLSRHHNHHLILTFPLRTHSIVDDLMRTLILTANEFVLFDRLDRLFFV